MPNREEAAAPPPPGWLPLGKIAFSPYFFSILSYCLPSWCALSHTGEERGSLQTSGRLGRRGARRRERLDKGGLAAAASPIQALLESREH